MTKIKIFIAIISSAILLMLAPTSAQAATYKWNNMTVEYGSIKVAYCAGGTGTYVDGAYTTRDICKVWLPYNKYLFAYVDETGTVLIDKDNCGSSRWISFTSSTDTSRTAAVTTGSINCA